MQMAQVVDVEEGALNEHGLFVLIHLGQLADVVFGQHGHLLYR